MSRPKPADIEQAFNVLRGSYVDPHSGDEAMDRELRTLQRRLERAIQRNSTGTATPDGFPSGGDGPRGVGVSTPTENGALSLYRLDHPHDPEHSPGRWVPVRDKVHDLTTAAVGYIEQAAHSLAAARSKMNELDVLTGVTSAAVLPPEACESCARVVVAGEPIHSDMYMFSDVGHRLSRRWRLCGWCYDVVRRTDQKDVSKRAKGRAEKDTDWLPSLERIVEHDDDRQKRDKAS